MRRSSFLASFMDSLCRVKNKIMYVLLWRTVYALTLVLFWCLFPELRSHRHKITLSWAHKQFATRVHSLFYISPKPAPHSHFTSLLPMITHIIPIMICFQIIKSHISQTDFEIMLWNNIWYMAKQIWCLYMCHPKLNNFCNWSCAKYAYVKIKTCKFGFAWFTKLQKCSQQILNIRLLWQIFVTEIHPNPMNPD